MGLLPAGSQVLQLDSAVAEIYRESEARREKVATPWCYPYVICAA